MANMKFLSSCASTVAWALACAGFGCSAKVVDLGNNPQSSGPVYSTGIPTEPDSGATGTGATPFRIVDKEQSGCAGNWGSSQGVFTVASGQLYWLSQSLTESSSQYFLRNCAIDHCASSLVTSDGIGMVGGVTCGSEPFATSFQIDQDRAYWFYALEDVAIYSASEAPMAEITATLSSIAGARNFVVDHGIQYTAIPDDSVQRCQASDCENTMEYFTMTPPTGARSFQGAEIHAQDSDYLYLVEQSTVSGSGRLLRIAKDFSVPFEVLLDPAPTNVTEMSVHGDTLYWLESAEMGQVKSCPKSGCVGSPMAVMSGLYQPSGMAVDDSNVYVLEPTETQVATTAPGNGVIQITREGRVLKCPITGCSEPQDLYTYNAGVLLGNLVVDERFVYVAGNYCDETNANPSRWYDGCAFIAAIPK